MAGDSTWFVGKGIEFVGKANEAWVPSFVFGSDSRRMDGSTVHFPARAPTKMSGGSPSKTRVRIGYKFLGRRKSFEQRERVEGVRAVGECN